MTDDVIQSNTGYDRSRNTSKVIHARRDTENRDKRGQDRLGQDMAGQSRTRKDTGERNRGKS